jgi:NADPH-dependent curcumin reductase CurA
VAKGLEWHLVRRPNGWPVNDDFELVETDIGAPQDGDLLVRNLVMSVDPYMRGRMNDGPSYAPPYDLHSPMHGAAVGRVEESKVPEIEPGALVRHGLGWRQWAVVRGEQAERVDPEADGIPASAYLGVLGMPGLTAWVGLYDIAEIRPGETIFISAAGGAVGSIAGQLAKLAGLRVIGSAGGSEKVEALNALGFDTALDYRAGDLAQMLGDAAGSGIDCYFDNVGGDHLAAALECINPFGRIAACGMVSAYNDVTAMPANLVLLVSKRVTLRGFIVRDHLQRAPAFRRHVSRLLREGRIVARETRRDGIEAAVDALLDVLRGGHHIGKMVVRL